jgi:hypothetical protein
LFSTLFLGVFISFIFARFIRGTFLHALEKVGWISRIVMVLLAIAKDYLPIPPADIFVLGIIGAVVILFTIGWSANEHLYPRVRREIPQENIQPFTRIASTVKVDREVPTSLQSEVAVCENCGNRFVPLPLSRLQKALERTITPLLLPDDSSGGPTRHVSCPKCNKTASVYPTRKNREKN